MRLSSFCFIRIYTLAVGSYNATAIVLITAHDSDPYQTSMGSTKLLINML